MISSAKVNNYLLQANSNVSYNFTFNIANKDAIYLDWILQQFIIGEMTGLKEGSALQNAPTLQEADFLAQQIRDEIKHTRIYVKILDRLRSQNNYSPAKVPSFFKLLVQPINGRLWQEHVLLDKAIGEYWVLQMMIALQQTIDDKRILSNLDSIAKDEVQHIHFGEQQTLTYTSNSKFYRYYLRGLFLRNDIAMKVFFKLVSYFFKRKKREDLLILTNDFFLQSQKLLHLQAEKLLVYDPKNNSILLKLCNICISQCIYLYRLVFFRQFYKPVANS